MSGLRHVRDIFEFDKIFLYLGRFEAEKNPLFLINLWQEVEKRKLNYMLVMVGRGSQDNQIKEVIEQKQIKNILIQNWMSDPSVYTATADALLVPSKAEGYGLVIREAFLFRTPIITHKVGIVSFELPEQEGVYIVSMDDTEEWIKALELVEPSKTKL